MIPTRNKKSKGTYKACRKLQSQKSKGEKAKSLKATITTILYGPLSHSRPNQYSNPIQIPHPLNTTLTAHLPNTLTCLQLNKCEALLNGPHFSPAAAAASDPVTNAPQKLLK